MSIDLQPGELQTAFLLCGLVTLIMVQVGLLFLAVLEGSAVLLWAGLLLLLTILLWLHLTFRHMCTALTVLAYLAVVPSAVYLYTELGLQDMDFDLRRM